MSKVDRGMFNTSGGVQYIGGYHEYIGGILSTSGDIMIHVREQVIKAFDLYAEPRCTEHPPMYS